MLKRVAQQAGNLLKESRCCTLQRQQSRNTVILRRMYPIRPWKKGQTDRLIRKKKDLTYVIDEDLRSKPAGNMEVLLTKNLPGIGQSGEVVTLPKRIARNRMLPFGVAVYPSPDNLQKYTVDESSKKEEIKDATQKTIQQLEAMTLPIPMNSAVSWVLNANHVRLAFRKTGVVAPIHAITLPTDPVTEPGNITVGVRINGKYDVKVNGVVFHFQKGEQNTENYVRVWSKTKETLQDALKKLDITS